MADQNEDQGITYHTKFERKEKRRMKSMVGMVVTAASFTEEDGYMIEFDHQFKLRSCCPHTIWLRRRVQ